MRFLLSFGILIAAVLLVLMGSMADEPTHPPISEEASNNEEKSGDGYGTNDKIDSAKPIDLPTPTGDPQPIDPDENSDSLRESESGEGSSGE